MSDWGHPRHSQSGPEFPLLVTGPVAEALGTSLFSHNAPFTVIRVDMDLGSALLYPIQGESMECCPSANLAADVIGYTRLISEDENEHKTALPALREGRS